MDNLFDLNMPSRSKLSENDPIPFRRKSYKLQLAKIVIFILILSTSLGPNHTCGNQAASFRRRRKSKNSTPSRRRRFIMSKSRTISPTIAPILRGRK